MTTQLGADDKTLLHETLVDHWIGANKQVAKITINKGMWGCSPQEARRNQERWAFKAAAYRRIVQQVIGADLPEFDDDRCRKAPDGKVYKKAHYCDYLAKEYALEVRCAALGLDHAAIMAERKAKADALEKDDRQFMRALSGLVRQKLSA